MAIGRKIVKLRYDAWSVYSEIGGETCAKLPFALYQRVGEDQRRIIEAQMHSSTCPFCGAPLCLQHRDDVRDTFRTTLLYLACDSCGFWRFAVHDSTSPPVYTVPHVKRFDYETSTPSLSFLSNEILKNREKVYAMNPTKFEVFVGSVLSDFFECEVHHVGQTGDDGIDLIALVGDAPLMIQVKRRGNPAATEGVDVVKLLFASAFAKGASNGMVVTSAKHFTRPAKTWSESRRIVETGFRLDLIDIHSLMSMIDAVASNDSEPAWQQHRGRTIPDFIGDMGKFAHKVMEFSDFDAVIVNEDDESLIVFEHADLTKVYSIELKAAKSCLCTANLSFAKMKEQCKPASIQVLHGEAAEHLASSVPLGSLNPLENRWERLFPDDIVRFDF